MNTINADMYEQMDAFEVFKWKYGLNEEFGHYSFYKVYYEAGERQLEWF